MLEVMSDKRIQDLGIKLIIAGEFYENQKEYITKIQDLNISDYLILKNNFRVLICYLLYFRGTHVLSSNNGMFV